MKLHKRLPITDEPPMGDSYSQEQAAQALRDIRANAQHVCGNCRCWAFSYFTLDYNAPCGWPNAIHGLEPMPPVKLPPQAELKPMRRWPEDGKTCEVFVPINRKPAEDSILDG